MKYRKKGKRLEFIKVFFDTETYYIKENDEQIVACYLIGACTSEPNSYVRFIGNDCTEKFLEWLFELSAGKIVWLYAFNLDYDFWAIYPILCDNYPNLKIRYKLTGEKKFISGGFKCSSLKLNITLKDLWIWNKSMSLADYYDEITQLSKTEEYWKSLLEKYGFSELKKLQLEDYAKFNLRNGENGGFYYDTVTGETKKLDLLLELKYLKQDVIGLPLIDEYIEWFKRLCCETLNILQVPKSQCIHSIPSFSKYLLEKKIKEPLDVRFRYPVDPIAYKVMDLSYFGGFSAVNKDLCRVEGSRDSNNVPNIKTYDVNSMYPNVMAEGVPYGDLDTEPFEDEPYCIWYEIYFEKALEDGSLYKWKKKYDIWNNSFFPKHFFKIDYTGVVNTKTYILDSIYDVFVRACDSHIKILETRYQRLTKDLAPFVNELYEIKSNKEKYSAPVIKAIKLILNSLYGKFAERFHETYYELDGTDRELYKKWNVDEQRWCILSGLYITSHSRAKLIKACLDEIDGGNIPLCVDTDSIKMIVRNKVKLDVDSARLGAWKFEGEFTDFYHINKCKKYCEWNADTNKLKLVYSGVPGKYLDSLSIVDLKTLYNPNNDVLFPTAKTYTTRNKYWQIVIRNIDVRFNLWGADNPTHIYKEGKILEIKDGNT